MTAINIVLISINLSSTHDMLHLLICLLFVNYLHPHPLSLSIHFSLYPFLSLSSSRPFFPNVSVCVCVLIDACIGDIIKEFMFGRISFAQSLHTTTHHTIPRDSHLFSYSLYIYVSLLSSFLPSFLPSLSPSLFQSLCLTLLLIVPLSTVCRQPGLVHVYVSLHFFSLDCRFFLLPHSLSIFISLTLSYHLSPQMCVCVLIDACIGDIIKEFMFGRISFAQSLHTTPPGPFVYITFLISL
jgi:hypothetical protein